MLQAIQMSLFGMGHQSTSELKSRAVGEVCRGAESMYVRISETEGIKIFRTPIRMDWSERENFNAYYSVDALMQTELWKMAETQVAIMKYFHSISRGPEVFELSAVYDEDRQCFFPAIKMEHIQHTPIHNMGWNKQAERIQKSYNRFRTMLEERYGDVDGHTGNIVWDVNAKRFKIIDFGAFTPMLATEDGRAGIKVQFLRRKEYQRLERERMCMEPRQQNFFVNPGFEFFGHMHEPKGLHHIIVHVDIGAGYIKHLDEKPLPAAGMDRVKEMKRRHREFINKFVPKQDDVHSRKFKNAA